ncbi:MAG: Fe-S cluster assembly protein SufD [Actinobacteria bacterium]|nr:Fe-S cluster assembly protein SufD [Actinomycetota bacterium]MBW3648693.1 Fe-S cluster assembly protein SufD [Actinomycetota bacterium]
MDGSVAVGVKPSTPRSPADVRPERVRSRDVDAFPVPTGREEEWRFTPLDRVQPLLDGAPSDAHLTVDSELPAGVELVEVAAGELDVPLPIDRLAALALARSGSALVVRVPKALELDAPVVLRLSGEGTGEVVWGHVVLDIAEQSRATVVLEHTGSARYAACVSVLVGDGAALQLVQVQDWAGDTVHVAHVASRLGRDAKLLSTQVSLGGDLVRITESVDFAGPGGDVELRGVSFADGGQHLEHRLLVDHSAPHCRSRVTYKSALQGDQAHTVWIGDVLIRAAAEGTDTYELNRNLLLTPEARADSVPNLEIETGEIAGAGHASATGRFDDEQLFYLMARGIPADDARRMVVRGFFAEVIESIGVPALEQRLMATIEDELGRAFA